MQERDSRDGETRYLNTRRMFHPSGNPRGGYEKPLIILYPNFRKPLRIPLCFRETRRWEMGDAGRCRQVPLMLHFSEFTTGSYSLKHSPYGNIISLFDVRD